MQSFSESEILSNCPHCNVDSFALNNRLEITDNFFVVCDNHPITRGHILIIPKKHISCIAEYPPSILPEFFSLYKKCSEFLTKIYGSVSTFEHGIIGQTVFHSHIQMFPFIGSVIEIVPEGLAFLTKIKNIDELIQIYKRDQKYLYFSLGKKMWVVDTRIGKPRFFRDRFASVLHHPERGNWKEMHINQLLMKEAQSEKQELQEKWKEYFA